MFRKSIALIALVLAAAAYVAPAHADYVTFGYGWGGGPGWHHRPYPGPYWGPPPVYYVAPPPVVYYEPAPPPVVVYQAPAPAAAIPANQASQTFTDQQGRTCREYQTTIMINGLPKASYGTACLMADGQWRIVN
ncbi:MAG TPA: hypothetical protein VM661_00595 [Candidatus Sulfotelmatobacter sp.]|jgi:hypothetical protein|nr:hypothetical protein [Candidatus Sulfotelmatobacter sp.]